MYKNEALSRLHEYAEEMKASELSQRTITKYLADIRQWLDSQSETILPGDMRRYKDGLADKYSASSINSKLISINRYLKWLGQNELLVKTQRIQKSSSLEHILTKNDYNKMLSYAKETGRIKLFHIVRTIALTDIRIGELKAITVEAVTAGSAEGEIPLHLPVQHLMPGTSGLLQVKPDQRRPCLFGKDAGKVHFAGKCVAEHKASRCKSGDPIKTRIPPQPAAPFRQNLYGRNRRSD